MAKSFKKVPVTKGTSEWKNSKAAKKQSNKVIRRYSIMATIEYTEDGDPYEIYEENVITRSQVHKIKTAIPPKIWDIEVGDRSKVKEYARKRNSGDHDAIEMMRNIIHAYMK